MSYQETIKDVGNTSVVCHSFDSFACFPGIKLT